MNRLKPLRGFAFLLGLGVVIAIAGAAVRPGHGLEMVGGWAIDGTCSFDISNADAGGDYELELVDIIPGRNAPYHIAGYDEDVLPIFSASHMANTKPPRAISSWLFNARGETLAMLDGKWTICPTGAIEPVPELLVWWPESWYTNVHESRVDLHLVDRFRWNYSHDFKLLHANAFMRALKSAALGESLNVYTRLLATVPGEPERLRTLVDPLFSAEDGITFTDGERRFAVMLTDGGYHNVDRFYMLLAQPALAEGTEYALVGTNDIEGGYRGVFCVDLVSGETLWTVRTGASPVRTWASDLDGDGVDELLVQCYCPENGVSGEGMTDAGTCYIICLDQSGNILWKKRSLGVHLGALTAVADVTGDGSPEVVSVWSSGQHMDMGYASVLSSDGRPLAERTSLGGLYGIAVADFDGDGASEIVSGGQEGLVVMLDGDLKTVAGFVDTVDFKRIPNWRSRTRVVPDIRKIELEQLFQRVIPLAAYDLDGDGDIEVIGLSVAWAHTKWLSHNRDTIRPPRSDLIVFDSELREEARVVIHERDWGFDQVPFDAPASLRLDVYPADIDGDGVMEVLLSAGPRGLQVFKVTPAGGDR